MEFNNLRIPFILEKKIFTTYLKIAKFKKKILIIKEMKKYRYDLFLYFFKSPAIYHDGQYHKVIISSIDFEALD